MSWSLSLPKRFFLSTAQTLFKWPTRGNLLLSFRYFFAWISFSFLKTRFVRSELTLSHREAEKQPLCSCRDSFVQLPSRQGQLPRVIKFTRETQPNLFTPRLTGTPSMEPQLPPLSPLLDPLTLPHHPTPRHLPLPTLPLPLLHPTVPLPLPIPLHRHPMLHLLHPMELLQLHMVHLRCPMELLWRYWQRNWPDLYHNPHSCPHWPLPSFPHLRFPLDRSQEAFGRTIRRWVIRIKLKHTLHIVFAAAAPPLPPSTTTTTHYTLTTWKTICTWSSWLLALSPRSMVTLTMPTTTTTLHFPIQLMRSKVATQVTATTTTLSLFRTQPRLMLNHMWMRVRTMLLTSLS